MEKHYRFSAPGRTEIGGNHTDHQHGCVLAAAVNLETLADVTLNGSSTICVRSEGYSPFEVNLTDLSVHEEEKNTTAALVRGVAAAFARRGAKLQGFDMAVSSTVLPGSGLSRKLNMAGIKKNLYAVKCVLDAVKTRLAESPAEMARLSEASLQTFRHWKAKFEGRSHAGQLYAELENLDKGK